MTLGEKEQEFLGALRVSMPAACTLPLLLTQAFTGIERPLAWISLVWPFIWY